MGLWGGGVTAAWLVSFHTIYPDERNLGTFVKMVILFCFFVFFCFQCKVTYLVFMNIFLLLPHSQFKSFLSLHQLHSC